jgi:MFS family permease
VLGWSALKLGFAACVLPLSVGIGAQVGQRIVTKQGPRAVTMIAMVGLAAGLVILSGVPLHNDYTDHMLPALLLFGPAFGAAITSYSVTTLSGVAPGDAGLASGLNNTFECIFGALGTAIMGSVAATKTASLLHGGTPPLSALNGGFSLAFLVAIVFPALALLASLALRRDETAEPEPFSALESAAALHMETG